MNHRDPIKVFFLASLAFACPLVALRGQSLVSTPPQTNLAKTHQTRNEAANLLKAGDLRGAVDKLRTGVVTGAGAPSADVQVVSALGGLAKSLAADQHPAAASTAALAVTQAESAKGGASPAERAYLSALSGDLYETVIGDRVKARVQYQLALNLDSRRKDAAQGLWRIARLEALLQAKAQENTTLRNAGK